MSLPGTEWRVLAHRRNGDRVALENEGVFDELVVGPKAWLHLEKMDTRSWWLRIGNYGFDIRVNDDGSVRLFDRAMNQERPPEMGDYAD